MKIQKTALKEVSKKFQEAEEFISQGWMQGAATAANAAHQKGSH